MGDPPVVEIRFRGRLGPSLAQMFEGSELAREPGRKTALTRPISVQAVLHGVRNRIGGLSVPLFSVRRLSQDGAKTEGGVRYAAHD